MRVENFKISRYRSLVDFSVPEFEPTTIFFGENNVGKSNILNALYTIFKRKKETTTELGKLSLPKNFYSGVIEKFSNDFYNNEVYDISFSVALSVNNSELNLETNLYSKLIRGKTIKSSSILFEGFIAHSTLGNEYAEIFLSKVVFNGMIVYQYQRDHEITYFPTIDRGRKRQAELAQVFSKLVEPFNDCVTIIESSRDMLPTQYIKDENIELITPSNFKHFLHNLYH